MNMPNFAACHHFMRRIWSGVDASEAVSSAAAGFAATCATPLTAIDASDAPVPSKIFRRLILEDSIHALVSSRNKISLLRLFALAAISVLSSSAENCQE